MFTWPDWMTRFMGAYTAIPLWARYSLAALGLVILGGLLL